MERKSGRKEGQNDGMQYPFKHQIRNRIDLDLVFLNCRKGSSSSIHNFRRNSRIGGDKRYNI